MEIFPHCNEKTFRDLGSGFIIGLNYLMEEQKKRSFVKTLTWRITASLVTFVIVLIITGDWKIGGSIATIEVITKIFFYYFHERIWSKIKWGTKKKWWWLS